jgi:regulator of RNase E activity RraA
MSEADVSIGLRRLERSFQTPSNELFGALSRVGTADLSDAMHQANSMDSAIQALHPATPRVVGPALTVAVPSGANEVRRAAIEMLQPGDVLVIAGRGNHLWSMLGDKLASIVLAHGAAGVVIDGYARDVEAIGRLGVHVFCRGATTSAGPKAGPGEINVPVACGGVVVNPGDLIVADADGVVVVPRAEAEAIADDAARRAQDAI